MKIDGFEVATEEVLYRESVAIRTTSKVVSMTETEPPAEAYTVPADCEEKEQLSLQDLRG
jgi:hypothetical protein